MHLTMLLITVPPLLPMVSASGGCVIAVIHKTMLHTLVITENEITGLMGIALYVYVLLCGFLMISSKIID